MSIDAMKMALEALMQTTLEDVMVEVEPNVWEYKSIVAIQALRQAIEQAEKPPVKTYAGGKLNYCTPVDAVNMTQDCVDETAKSEHEWVGLTTSEVIECQESSIYDTYINIEAKLKEKNVP